MSARITALPTPPSRSAPSTFSTRADAFLASLPTFVTEANALADEVQANADALASPGLSATSTTSLTIAVGNQSLTVQAAKSFVAGMSLKIAYTTDPAKWMHGDVVSYDPVSGALVVQVTLISGSGTYAAWTISLSAPTAEGDIPATTKMYFYQNTAPVGWTIDSSVVDTLLGIKGGSQAYNVNGGNLAGTWTQPNHTHTTGSFTLTTNEIPAHSHTKGCVNSDPVQSGTGANTPMYWGPTENTGSTGGGASHNHGATGNGATANTWRPYAAVGIIATKD